MSLVSDIKLIRTDTTLDLSQKAEKGMKFIWSDWGIYTSLLCRFRQPIWDVERHGLSGCRASFQGFGSARKTLVIGQLELAQILTWCQTHNTKGMYTCVPSSLPWGKWGCVVVVVLCTQHINLTFSNATKYLHFLVMHYSFCKRILSTSSELY